jgi:hypothetical protein
MEKNPIGEQYPGAHYQPLFDHMQQEHGLTLLESEMTDIIDLVRKMEQPVKKTSTTLWGRHSEIINGRHLMTPAGFYNAMNELGDELQAPTGARWVKASDRLPGFTTPVRWRDGNDHSHVTDGKIPLIDMAKPFLVGWEWYDESGADERPLPEAPKK